MMMQGIMEPERWLPWGWIGNVIQVLGGILKNIGIVDVVKVVPSLGPNTFASEVIVRVRETMPKMRHVLVGILGVVVIEMAWVPWCVQRHDNVWK